MISDFYHTHPTAFYLLLLGEIVWLSALVFNLRDEEMKDTDKICWTIVLCTLNLLGLVLFILFSPHNRKDTLQEDSLKRAANEGRL